jgi:hypothetical protein
MYNYFLKSILSYPIKGREKFRARKLGITEAHRTIDYFGVVILYKLKINDVKRLKKIYSI